MVAPDENKVLGEGDALVDRAVGAVGSGVAGGGGWDLCKVSADGDGKMRRGSSGGCCLGRENGGDEDEDGDGCRVTIRLRMCVKYNATLKHQIIFKLHSSKTIT